MKNIVLVAALLCSGIASALDNKPEIGIPYSLVCNDVNMQMGFINLELQRTDDGYALNRGFITCGVWRSIKMEQLNFNVSSLGPKDSKFHLESVSERVFAGGGKETGSLQFDLATGLGTWTEVVTTMPEDGVSEVASVSKTRSYNVKCDLAQ